MFQVLERETEVVSLSHHGLIPPTHSWLYSSVSRLRFPSSRVVEVQGVKALAYDLVGVEEPGKEREVVNVVESVAAGDGL